MLEMLPVGRSADGDLQHITVPLEGPVARSPISTIYVGRSSALATPIAVKVCTDLTTGALAPEAARTYHDALITFSRLAGSDPILVCPKPLGVEPDQGLVVMEWIDGQNLARVFARGPAARSSAAGRLAGHWLGRLHGLDPSPAPLPIERSVAHLEHLTTRHPEAFRGAIRARAVELLHEAVGAVGSIKVSQVRTYGDCKPANFIWRQERLYGIDMGPGLPGPATQDVAHFLNHIAMSSRLLNPFGSAVTRLEQEFLHGYRDAGAQLSELPLAWSRLLDAMRICARYRLWSAPPRSLVTTWMLNRVVARLTSELSAASAGNHLD